MLPPGPLAVIVVAEPTEFTQEWRTGRSGTCGPDAVINSYAVLDIVLPGDQVTAVLDVGASGPATPIPPGG